MKFRPGNTLIIAMIVLVVIAGLGFVMANVWVIALAIGACVIAASIAEAMMLRRLFKQIDVRRVVPPSVARGRAFSVQLDIRNDSPAICQAELREVLPADAVPRIYSKSFLLKPGLNSFSYPLIIPQRGLHDFGDAWLRVRGRFALVEAQKTWPLGRGVRVLPESLLPSDDLSKDAMDEMRLLDQVKESRHRGEGTEFESLSEYREGDDIRRIDWRSSARQNRLIMCRYQLEQHRDIVILVDCGRLMGTAVGNGTKLDCAIDAALVLAGVALRSGDRCGVGVFDSKVRGYLAPVAGVTSHKTLIERLYNVKPGWVETNFAPMFAVLQNRQRKRALVLIISDMMEAETTERYRAAMVSLRARHEVVFAALRTPLLAQTAALPIIEPKDAARKTFALRLMREREHTLHTMKHNGIHILDVEPRQLTIPLLNSYIELKQRTVA